MHHARANTSLRPSKRCRALNRAILETLENRRLLSVSILSSLFNETNGANPASGVTMDSAGNLFGTTSNNGLNGDGTVFEILHGTTAIITLASFNGANGKSPRGQVAVDSDGNVYGDTFLGGANQLGAVWELVNGSHNITLLASFDGTNTGGHPLGGVTLAANNTLYGTASDGGANTAGTIFSYVPSTHTLSAIISLNSLYIDGMPIADAANDVGGTPSSNILIDSSGNLFGTAGVGGTTTDGTIDFDQGTVFEISSSGSFSVVAPFSGGAGGSQFPGSGVVEDSSGNLFGVTYNGGTNHLGTLYEVQNHTITTLFSFDATNQHPTDLIIDASGNLFGTTDGNGLNNGTDGTIFEFTHATLANGTPTLTTIASFNGSNGLDPEGNLVMDSSGNFYGTCLGGGNGNSEGTFYKVTTLGPATHLAFTAAPTTATTATSLFPAVTVAVEDANNNIVTTDSSNITLTLSNGPGTLGGTLKVAAINGVATFSNLTISAAGATDTLSATDGQLTLAISNPIAVAGAGGTPVLTPAIISSTVPANVIAGVTLHGASPKIHLTNSSATTEKGYTVKVYASSDTTLDTNTDALVTTLPEPKSSVTNKKPTPLTIPITSLPSNLAPGSYFLIVEIIDAANNITSVASANTITVTAPFITLTSLIAPIKKIKSAETITLNNTGNIEDSSPFSITYGFSFDALGTQPIGLSNITFTKALNISTTKPLKIHATEWSKILAGLHTAVPYFLTATLTDSDGHTTFAVSPNSFTL